MIFLFKFKMVHKAAETMHNINNTFGPGSASEHTVQWWFRKFCKGNKRLEDEEHSGWLSEANNQLRAIIEVDDGYTRSCIQLYKQLYTTIQEAAEELNVDHSTVARHLKQIGKVKKLDNVCLMN